MIAKLQQAWYSDSRWVWCLSMLTGLFWLLSAGRRQLFKWGVLSSSASDIPVVVVGNIGIGGNGKTPLVLALIESLRARGYQPAVLSRGYGAKQTVFPHLVGDSDPAQLVGDEPALIRQRNGCTVVIDPERARGVEYIQQNTQANIIICDDGLQHYAMQRDFEICVLDKRGIGNGFLLPMGPLREGKWRLNQVDAVVHNIGAAQSNTVGESINSLACPSNTFFMTLQPTCWINIGSKEQSSLADFSLLLQSQSRSQTITALAGIGDPNRFFDTLHSMQIKLDKTTAFADHHKFSKSDIPMKGLVLMTEKDAVKCVDFNLTNAWYLRIDATLDGAFYKRVEIAIQEKAARLNRQRA